MKYKEFEQALQHRLSDRVSQLTRRAAQAVRLQPQDKRRRLHRLSSSRSFVDAETHLRIYLRAAETISAADLFEAAGDLSFDQQVVGSNSFLQF